MTERSRHRTDEADRPDRALVAAHLAGDPSALAAIYDRYADPLYDTAAAMLSDRHDAEDLTHDVFVVAAQRLDQLRDPDRLRPWLFAILRHEVYRRTQRRARMRPTDLHTTGLAEMSAPPDPAAGSAGAERDELASFVRQAAAGLGERDQLLLELSVRQGLDGADLADAMGVSQQQCHVLVHRMRDRIQRSLGALTVARYGRTECPDLQLLLRGWDGTFDARTRKRIAGHVDECEVCERTSRRFAVIPLFAAAPAFAAPAHVRERVLGTVAGPGGGVPPATGAGALRFDAPGGFPLVVRRARRAGLLAIIATLLLLLLGGAWYASAVVGDDPPSPVARLADGTPGAEPTAAAASTTTTTTTATDTATTTTITTSTATIPSTTAPSTMAGAATTGAPSTSATVPSTTVPIPTVVVTLPPTTTRPSTTTTTPPPPPPLPPPPGALVLSAGTIDLGSTATRARLSLANTGGQLLTWSIDGDASPFIWSATTGDLASGQIVEVQVAIDRNPLGEGSIARSVTFASSRLGTAPVTVTASVERPPAVSIVSATSSLFCPRLAGPPIVVSVADESAIAGVELRWSGPGAAGSTPMTLQRSGWTGSLAPARVNGTWTWEAVATDARGNTGRTSAPFVVSGC